jgi:hypothetical protein
LLLCARRKVILGNMQGGSRNKGTFEVIVGDQASCPVRCEGVGGSSVLTNVDDDTAQVYSKRGAFGVYLPMQDLQVALDNMMKTK